MQKGTQMTRKQQTILTFEVRLELPVGANAAMVQQFLINACKEHKAALSTQSPAAALDLEKLIVKLSKKETTYA